MLFLNTLHIYVMNKANLYYMELNRLMKTFLNRNHDKPKFISVITLPMHEY